MVGTPINLKGADGNANVTRYIFPGYDFSSFSYFAATISGINNSEENAWIVYLKTEYFTYHMPGWGANGNSDYMIFHDAISNSVEVYIFLQSGPGEAYDSI